MIKFLKQTWPIWLALAAGWMAAGFLFGQTVLSTGKIKHQIEMGENGSLFFTVKGFDVITVNKKENTAKIVRPVRPDQIEIKLVTSDGKKWKAIWVEE